MGLNTAVVILNDALGTIEEDPNFGKSLADAIKQASSRPGKTLSVIARSGNYSCDAARVVATCHSSDSMTVEVGGNTAKRIK